MNKSLAGQSTQLPFDLASEPSVQREDLIESPANLTAISLIDAWPEWPGNVTVLAGPVGSGKSHIGNVWIANAGGVICSASSISQQMQQIQASLDNGGNVLVEDAGPDLIDETGLFHLINSVRQAKAYCLITSRSWPLEWQVELPDLLSRLKATQVVELLEPDDTLLKQVIIKLFADRQLIIDEKVVDYCVVRMERSLDTATRLVAAIDQEALSRKATISRQIAGKALEKLGMR